MRTTCGRWMGMGLVTLAVSAATLTGGCVGTPSSAINNSPTMEQVAGTYSLAELNGSTHSASAGAGNSPEHVVTPTMTIAARGRVSGLAGVNRYSTTLDQASLEGGNWTLAPIIVTKMAGPPQLMDLETRFIGALSTVDQARIVGERLELRKNNRTLLVFTRRPE